MDLKQLQKEQKKKDQAAKREKAARERRLSEEENRLRESYTDLKPDVLRVVDGLIRRAAFMRLQLEEYERDLDENGYVEMFSQSKDAEPYERERPVARLYSTSNKNYQSIIRQLADLVPDKGGSAPKEPDQFERIRDRHKSD